MTSRLVVRLGLAGAIVLAMAASIVPLIASGARASEAWATLAASLAVVTAVIAAWTSQRVLELQEDAQDPIVSVAIDARRRYQLVQFRVSNLGLTPAFDVSISWDEPLSDADGQPVRISPTSEGPDLMPVLLPSESTAINLGASHRFFARHQHRTFSGSVEYRTASGRTRRRSFRFSTDVHQKSLVHDEEEPKTHFELQKLPKSLDAIADQLADIKSALERRPGET